MHSSTKHTITTSSHQPTHEEEPAVGTSTSTQTAAEEYRILRQHVEQESTRITGNMLTATFNINERSAIEVRLSTDATNNTQHNTNVDNQSGGETDEMSSASEGEQSNAQPTQQMQPQTARRSQINRASHNCARDFVDSIAFQRHRLRQPTTCDYCEAILFPSETQSQCCLNGAVHLHLLQTPPDLMYLYTSQTEQGKHFRENIRSYNHVFAFTSMGVHIDEELANATNGIYTYRAQGSIYHRIGSLLPQPGERPRYLQMYIYDTDRELDYRMLENSLVRRDVIAILKRVLDQWNPYVQVFRQMSQREDLQDLRLHIRELPGGQHQYNLPTSDQVAAILVGGEDPLETNERDIIVQTRSCHLMNVPDTTGYYDALQYPLLHPRGNFGWDLNLFNTVGNRISCRAFYSYILQIRQNYDSLLLRGGRLLQQYVVDTYVKILTQQLRYLRDHQQNIRAELYQGLQDSVNTGTTNAGNIGRRIILPASFIGSPRDMHHRYHDAMALVQTFGKPDLFITVTCNPNWEEIRNNLLEGQSAQDRPDLTTRVFHAKCQELKTDIFKKGVLGKVVAHVHVIEFQKRGLPHAHILIILDENDKLHGPDDYDKIVRAEMPDPLAEPELYNVVIRHMIHGPCGHFNRSSRCMKSGKCKKNFPKQFAPSTVQGQDSYPIYRRRDNGREVILGNGVRVDNRWVVPYNPWLLRKYNCRINVEVCSSIKSVKYLYKYVYKGPDRISMGVSTQTPNNNDEITQFINARWICPQEAIWRILKFPLNKISPAVYSLQVHLPDMQQVTFNQWDDLTQLLNNEITSRTMLTAFFEKNENDRQARQYLYREFPTKFKWVKSTRTWERRRRNNKVIGRLYTVSPAEGERYYLRILLNHGGS